MSYEDFSVSNLDTGSLSGMAQTGASNGNSMVVNLSGATQSGLSGKVAGTKYFVNSSGSIVDIEPTTTPKAFLGTGLSASEILVGKDLDPVTPTSIQRFTDVPLSMNYSGTTLEANDASLSFVTSLGYHTGYDSVSASGTATVFSATGAGVCRFFIISPNVTSNQTMNMEVYLDDVLVISSGQVNSRTASPLSLVGEYHGHISTSYSGIFLNHGNLKFNSKFEVRRAGGVATSFLIGYKIIGI